MALGAIYDKGYIIDYKEGDSSMQRLPLEHLDDLEDKAHTIIEGETLDAISYKYYGTPLYWYAIADVNGIQNPFELTVGQDIIIPNIKKYE